MREAVYAGLVFIGETVERDSRRFEALDRRGQPLGVFECRAKAARAIFEHDLEQQAERGL